MTKTNYDGLKLILKGWGFRRNRITRVEVLLVWESLLFASLFKAFETIVRVGNIQFKKILRNPYNCHLSEPKLVLFF